MTPTYRWSAPRLGLLAPLLLLVACSAVTPTPTPDPAVEHEAFDAAICPVFDAIVEVDPRLADLRSVGSAGEPGSIDADEVEAVILVLGDQLDALEAVPDWPPGRSLRLQLIQALHAIRARLLLVSADVEAADALERLADLPFIASDSMDLAFNKALEAGHSCVAGS